MQSTAQPQSIHHHAKRDPTTHRAGRSQKVEKSHKKAQKDTSQHLVIKQPPWSESGGSESEQEQEQKSKRARAGARVRIAITREGRRACEGWASIRGKLSVASTSTAIRLKHVDSVGREYRMYNRAAIEAEEDEDGVHATDMCTNNA